MAGKAHQKRKSGRKADKKKGKDKDKSKGDAAAEGGEVRGGLQM
jgi:hypothetical protein